MEKREVEKKQDGENEVRETRSRKRKKRVEMANARKEARRGKGERERNPGLGRKLGKKMLPMLPMWQVAFVFLSIFLLSFIISYFFLSFFPPEKELNKGVIKEKTTDIKDYDFIQSNCIPKVFFLIHIDNSNFHKFK